MFKKTATPALMKFNFNEALKNNCLDLTNICFFSLSKKDQRAIIERIHQENVLCLIMKGNGFGSGIDLEDWQYFCQGLRGSKLQELFIEDNELFHFTQDHWDALDGLVSHLPLEKLSLQNNKLYALPPDSFQRFKSLVSQPSYPCLISCNNWEKNMAFWNELINANKKTPLHASLRFQFSHPKKQASSLANEEIKNTIS